MAGNIAGRAAAAERLRSLRSKKNDDGYVQVSDRLNAWWEGREALPEDMRSSPDLTVKVDDGAKDLFDSWDDDRARVSEAIWGTGFINPGTSAFARMIMAPARINSRKIALDLAAGLGGTALLLAREAGARVDAAEPIESLYLKGRRLVAGTPVSNQVDFQQADFSSLELPAGRYDLIYSRERLFTTKFKPRLMEQVAKGLRPGGQFLCTDYVVASKASSMPEIADWIGAEPDEIYPWTLLDYRKAMKKLGLNVLSMDDLSDNLLDEIKNAWHLMLSNMDSGKIDRELVNNVVLEGEIWRSRMKAIRAGGLKLVRINAVKIVPEES